MSIVSWRNAALALAVICAVQSCRACKPAANATTQPASDRRTCEQSTQSWRDTFAGAARRAAGVSDLPRPSHRVHGIAVPAWLEHFLPQPGERLGDYRDRMLPLAELAIAPQRERVARMRDALPGLDAHQRAELDGATKDAAVAIEQRVMNGIASGELSPDSFKAMAGVEVARDVLDIVDQGNTRFLSSLTPEQRTELSSNRFDFADYLTFATHWEDSLTAPK